MNLSVHAAFMRFSIGSRANKGYWDRTMWRLSKLAMSAAIAAFLFTAAGQTAEPGCVEWSNAGPIIAQNGLMPANVVYQMVQQRLGGKIVSQALCGAGGGFVYKLVVLGPTGQVTNVTVDARTGQF
jgi:uncharacterized membrane protein YkoI